MRTRPKERPHMVRIVDEKTKQEGWIPLIDDDGASLYPELMARTRRHQAPTHRRFGAVSRLGRLRTLADKHLKTLERVKGIEPSYSAWKGCGG